MVAGAVPVPLSGMLKELGVPVSLIVSVPVRAPVAVGLKITLTVQDAPEATGFAQVLGPARKSPVNWTGEIVMVALVPLVSVTGIGELCVFTNCSVGKVTEVGLTLTVELLPLPDSETVGEPLLVLIVAVSGLAPINCGENLM